MKPRTSRQIRSILVTLDGSPLAEQAIPLALKIARRARSKVRLVLVHRILPPPFYEESAQLYVSIDLAILRENGITSADSRYTTTIVRVRAVGLEPTT